MKKLKEFLNSKVEFSILSFFGWASIYVGEGFLLSLSNNNLLSKGIVLVVLGLSCIFISIKLKNKKW